MNDKDPKEIFDKFDTFLFDWDGVVVDSVNQWLYVLQKLVKEHYGLDVSIEDVGRNAFGYLDEPIKLGVDEKDFNFEEWRQIILEEVEKAKYDVSLVEGVKEFLEVLKSKNKKLAIVSSGHKTYIRDTMGTLDLKGYFDHVVSADDVDEHKPSKKPVLKAIDLVGSKKSTTVMIGDMKQDILAAKNADIRSLFFNPPVHINHDSEYVFKELRPDYVISSWSELLE